MGKGVIQMGNRSGGATGGAFRDDELACCHVF